MSPFQNILVGVDLNQYHPETLQPSAAAWWVVNKALWLARACHARITFFSAVHLSPEVLAHLADHDRHHVARNAEESALEILGRLVERAREQGNEARHLLARGRPWLELIRQVLRDHHDLLMVGRCDRLGLARLIHGTTPDRVIHNCPCPVWVTRPELDLRAPNILLADDLHPVCEQALKLVVDLARTVGSNVHLLHVLRYPLDRIWTTGLPSGREQEYRHKVREEAKKVLLTQLAHAGGSLKDPIQLHLVDDPGGLPDESILTCIRKHHIDLVVMGTGDRHGLMGTLMGNAAERMLPTLPCSLLTVKPADFVTPVSLS